MRSSVVRLSAALLLMLFNSLAFAAAFGTVSVSPDSTPVGIAANAVFIAQITDPNVIPTSVNLQSVDPQGRATVVGILHDDGLDGDAKAGDKVYSLRFTVYELTPGAIKYHVSAAISGKVTRDFSNLISFNVTGTSGVGISLSQPVNLSFVNTSPTLVSGTIGNAAAPVAVNGIQATKSGNKFQASIPLQEGNNTVTAVATNPNGTTSTASIQVTLDTTPPRVTVESPANGATTTEASVTVTGIVNDLVVGTVNSQQAKVKVNGNNAQVSNRTYTATGVPLQVGVNTLTVTGSDQTGNNATTTVKITREAITQPYIKLVSGNDQSGAIASQLAAPLVVQAINGTIPVPNVPVIFKIVENDGFLAPGNNKPQTIVVNTDAQGNAQAKLTLGNRAGAGNNIVQAYATGYQGTALFTASGTAKTAAKINVDSGNNQFGAIKQALALPLVAVVTDSGHNRVGGVPVTFTVKQGGGTINGASTYKTTSDSDGRILAVLSLGSQPGQDNNLVEASIDGLTGVFAAFTASGKAPGSVDKTAVSGVVQDNAGNAIAGVTMRMYTTNLGQNNNGINNTQHVEVVAPVVTDDKGAFKILPAPVGFFKLMADGSTATQGGKLFPTLEYDMVTVAGQNNTVGSPIYLPELDPQAKVCVTATTGGVLKMASSPGFSLTIAPGSATFPGGAKTGCVTVTPVNPDKVPMVPGFGQQPRYVVTIQPVGTTFNPPAAITIPNMDGLAPHAKTEMYSYDHDLAAFVAIGSGTVSADGSVIASDAGIGVMKAGWHCGGNPNTSGSAGSCPTCQKCEGDACVVSDSSVPPDSIKGDCKRIGCKGGAPTSIFDDSDKPSDGCKTCENGSAIVNKCKICENGTVKDVPLNPVSQTEKLTFGFPSDGVVKFNEKLKVLEKFNVKASINQNEIEGEITEQDCCAPSTGKGKKLSGSVRGKLGSISGEGKVWPFGVKDPTFDTGPLGKKGFASIQFKGKIFGGVYASLDADASGAVGYKKDDCSNNLSDRKGCFYGDLSSTLKPDISAKTGIELSTTTTCFFCLEQTVKASAEGILGKVEWKITLGAVTYNEASCDAGFGGGVIQPGELSFSISGKFTWSYEAKKGGESVSDSNSKTIEIVKCTMKEVKLPTCTIGV